MNALTILRVLRRRWLSIVALTVLGVVGAAVVNQVSEKVYSSTAELFVGNQTVESSQALNYANTFTQARVQSYVRVIDTPSVLEPVIEQLRLPMTVRELAPHVTATAPTNRVIIDIEAQFDDPQLAADVANATAASFSTYAEKLERTSASAPSPVKLTVTQPAYASSSPTSPSTTRNLALGLLLGLVLGVAQALMRNLLDTSVNTPEDVRALADLPTIGAIPLDRRTSDQPIALRADPHGSRSEAYRALRANLQFVDIDNPPKIIAVTSSVPGEGKTTTAINLAAALAEAGARVCLVDADLRRPRVADALGLIGEVGLTTVLVGKAELTDVLQNAAQNFAVLTAGEIPPNPTELLITEQARRLFTELAAHVDYLIVDTAPVVPVVDGAEVATMSDATVLVVRSGKSRRDTVRRGIEVLSGLGVRPVGVVINAIARKRSQGYSYYDYGYRAHPVDTGRGKRPTATPSSSTPRTDPRPLTGVDAPLSGVDESVTTRS